MNQLNGQFLLKGAVIVEGVFIIINITTFGGFRGDFSKRRQSLRTENKPEDHGRLTRGLQDGDGKRTRRLEDFFELEDGDRGLGYDGAAEATTLGRRCTKGDSDSDGMKCGVAGWLR
ncbi:hypothetical protein PIB30_100527 [Stylosanthes scabra]|uniref:Uncharacterized protein n=1 Tax=Stylosanthes scabra TaxID=79078 RepID=A0ABU6YWL4_9FABA|nr:hypothetical protein [Stylosanthes scabra]